MNNIIRHASATEVELQISQLDNRLQIVITDNGRGFVRNAGERGNGLTNFQERLQAMRGECHVESKPGSGTTVKFIVPLAPAAQADSPA
jgi:signal transduction histidine kinase